MTDKTPRKKVGIYGDDLTRPISDLIVEIRTDLSRARGRLSDIAFAHPGMKSRLESAEGLLTCGISYLFFELEEVRKWEKRVASSDGEIAVPVQES
jgi:hypothetical protein